MKRNTFIYAILFFCLNSSVFSQTICPTAKADLAVGAAEKYVYKTYTDKDGDEKQLHISVVRPSGNSPKTKRPLVIGLQGSAFLNTCFTKPCYVKYSENVLTPYFAASGFVTASVQYRLNSPFNFQALKVNDEKLKETQYKALQDARRAIKYIFDNADKFGVDTENVFLVGTSAGAITALQAVYLDDSEKSKNLSDEYGRLERRENIRGVASFSGAIDDLSVFKGAEKVPLLIVHGKEDGIVPFEKGFYLGMKKLAPVFGGKAIYDEALKQTIPVKGYFYDFGHEYPSKLQADIYKNASDFFRSYLNCPNEKTANDKAQ